mmetsp:Transcript_25953/g.60162  ORF Transcript_25953/g.60162 Transcript_25953/m.60162 type:complete len:302 (-) Transcript_25953:51-956(-)
MRRHQRVHGALAACVAVVAVRALLLETAFAQAPPGHGCVAPRRAAEPRTGAAPSAPRAALTSAFLVCAAGLTAALGVRTRTAASPVAAQAFSATVTPAGTSFTGASAAAFSAGTNDSKENRIPRRMLMPKNIKWRKPHKPPVKPFDTNRWKYKGEAKKGWKPHFGRYALQIKEEAWINGVNIEACRRMMVRTLRRDGGKVWLRCFPHSAITWRGKETRMGGGKGAIQFWVQAVRPGYILFEVDGCTEETARRAMHYIQRYLPFKTKFLIKEGPSRFELGLAGSLKSKKNIPEEFRKKSDSD